MAILNGNSDFNLSVTKGTEDKTIKIRFKKMSTSANPIRIIVSSPHVNIASKSYNNTTDSTYTEWIVRVSNYGDFKVHISTNRGYSYDYSIIKVRLSSTQSQTYKFTQTDYNKWLLSGVAVNLSFTLLGLTKLSYAVASGTAVATLAGFYFKVTNPKETMYDFTPRVGYSVRATYIDSGYNSITFKLEYLDEELDVKNTTTRQVLIDTF